jgi:hypothetical protein
MLPDYWLKMQVWEEGKMEVASNPIAETGSEEAEH